jgi:hypothetical protein
MKGSVSERMMYELEVQISKTSLRTGIAKLGWDNLKGNNRCSSTARPYIISPKLIYIHNDITALLQLGLIPLYYSGRLISICMRARRIGELLFCL